MSEMSYRSLAGWDQGVELLPDSSPLLLKVSWLSHSTLAPRSGREPAGATPAPNRRCGGRLRCVTAQVQVSTIGHRSDHFRTCGPLTFAQWQRPFSVGVYPGTEILFLACAPFDGPLTCSIGEKQNNLGHQASQSILVSLKE